MKKIITHAGTAAHADEFLSTCVILAADTTVNSVFRIPHEHICNEDLISENTYVIDMGKQHDEQKLNFDHHQLERFEVKDSKCAFTIVLKYLFPTIDLYEVLPILKSMEVLDCCGPDKAAKFINTKMTKHEFSQSRSLIDKFMLNMFANETNPITQQHPLFAVMKCIGNEIVYTIKQYSNFVNTLPKLQIVNTKNGKIANFCKSISKRDNFSEFVYNYCYQKQINVFATYDGTMQNTLLLYSFTTDKFDLYKLRNKTKHLIFAHKDGYLAKISNNITEKQLFDLIRSCKPQPAKKNVRVSNRSKKI